jgi:hypothetical protein
LPASKGFADSSCAFDTTIASNRGHPRNWLFLGNDRGGRAAAVHFSLPASCKRHGLAPWAYYRDVLPRLPALLLTADEDTLLSLLPHT